MDASPRNASPALQNGEKGMLFVCLSVLKLPEEVWCNPFPDITWETLSNLVIYQETVNPHCLR